MKLLITYDYGPEAAAKMRALGHEVVFIKESELNDQSHDLSDIEVLVCYNPFKSIHLDKMPALKHILLSSIGIDQLPAEQVLAREIVVTNNRGGYSKPMGEWIVWNILSGLKNSSWFELQKKKKTWKITTDVLEMVGKTIGFLGTGTIAQEAAVRLSGFEATRIGLNTHGTPHEAFDYVVSATDKLELAARCDAIVIALPQTPQTERFVDQAFLERMKPDAILINVSRGAVLDEAALIQALSQGRLRSVHIDVFEQEPLPETHPLWDIERVHITPHNSWISEMRNDRRLALILENLKRLAAGDPLLNVVDVRRGY
ncbi:NAD(P)-dependent oxidoreductase [Acidaminobacter hydrogenoformans]|uniref:Phosphoglycerate dehydrogenase n=1 Tax=Acidaminobacter hydrogenoformans DSM 2784 TaxID=1120920 RepID=A0A1G5S6P9_9FIRM|nr:NAD(P)-dependent oxidoreductase [Acidaminobacter hydrogenoformans]SCZ81239.1 Phosphoglycerate dehydrogenase [Acidaminobacter hydrogenoformans DSM 2784]